MSDEESTMHNFQASLLPVLANVTTIGVFVLSIGFMLRFLLALSKERKTSLAGFRLEYRVNSSLPNAATRQVQRSFSVQPPTQPDTSEREYDRGEFLGGAPQALKEVARTREYRFTWQEPNRA
jgi:hypothetical protein